MKRVVVVVLVVSSLLVGVAFASHVNVNDGRDARGELDIKRVVHSGTDFPKWTISTFKAWGRQKIWDQGYLAVFLDTFGSSRHDYYALIWAGRNQLRATLFRDRKANSDYRIKDLKFRRPSVSSVKVTVPLNRLKIDSNRATYNWFVQSTWTDGKCRQACFDWAPDIGRTGGGIEEPLPLNL